MVALEMTSFGPSDYRAGEKDYEFRLKRSPRNRRPFTTPANVDADAPAQPMIEVVDETGAPLAYVPADMSDGQARAHAAMIAAAPRLLDLARFAAAHVDEDSHAGVLRAFRAYCAEIVDRVEDQIVLR